MQPVAFKRIVRQFYKKQGRHDLPWRATTDPYKILVSEIMLQQTQVPRVIEKYKQFLKVFPTVQKLAHAALGEVLVQWSGLGYNRRAKFLKLAAETVVAEYNGKFPSTIIELERLPGVGPYTARAVAAFAYNIPSALIETNIRTVYIHHFFSDRTQVSDSELMPIIEQTADIKHAREWYWALMDYGAHLKSLGIKTHRASSHYAKQSKFEGSKRQIRGAIIKALTQGNQKAGAIYSTIDRDQKDIQAVLDSLVAEKLISYKRGIYSL